MTDEKILERWRQSGITEGLKVGIILGMCGGVVLGMLIARWID